MSVLRKFKKKNNLYFLKILLAKLRKGLADLSEQNYKSSEWNYYIFCCCTSHDDDKGVIEEGNDS